MAQKTLACVVLTAVTVTLGVAHESQATPKASKAPSAKRAAPSTAPPVVFYKPTNAGDSTVSLARDLAKLDCSSGYTLQTYKRADGAVVAYCSMMDTVVESSPPSCGAAKIFLTDDKFVAQAKTAFGVKDMCFDNKKNGLKREDLANYTQPFCLVSTYQLAVRAGADTCEKGFARPRVHMPGQPSVAFLQPSTEQIATTSVRCAAGSTMKVVSASGALSDVATSASSSPAAGSVLCQRN